MDIEKIAIKSAEDAGIKILEIYNSDSYWTEVKRDDSPLTMADMASHEIIVSYLKSTKIPMISEESISENFESRKEYNVFWLIDPLDGTKEFISRNGEFTINIALIRNGIPVFGVVNCPCQDKLFYGSYNSGTFLKQRNRISKLLKPKKNTIPRIVISRSHLNNETELFLGNIKKKETVKMGSSMKFMALAEGLVDVYPRFGPTMEWDTAASHAILKGLQIEVLDANLGTPLRYNKENLMNPYFIVQL